MIEDSFADRWQIRKDQLPGYINPQFQPQITQEELAEFRDLLERAREYDKLHHQADCETASKRERILTLAKDLGVEIDFL
jgi:hypothetical protein